MAPFPSAQKGSAPRCKSRAQASAAPRTAATSRGGVRCGPDGSALDVEGYLWNCQWDGSRIVRYAPDGSIDRVLALPARRPTCCCFGGPDLDVLYVTTARVGLTDPRPEEGAVLAFDPGVRGRPEPLWLG